jgi:8-oxo-dGTP pyrophosphatase MutT (NUDIX family)
MTAGEAKKKVLVWVYCRPEGDAPPLFLLLRTRAERGAFWQPITGSVDASEDVEVAASRELQEETSFSPSKPLRAVSSPFEFTSHGKQFLEYPFLAEVDASQRMQLRLDPHEHTEFQWTSAEQALELLKYESNARVLRDVLEELNN